MVTLAGFPMVSQLTTVTGDGRPSENALYDCVAACVDAMCRYFLKQPENSVFNPDHFKDVAYGEAWRNDGTDAARYVEFCQTLGIRLYSVQAATYLDAVHEARAAIDRGLPVILTILDPYVDTNLPQYANWTHALVAFEEDSAGLTVLDPFIGKPLYRSDAAWSQLLRSTTIWLAELEDIMIDIHTPVVGDYFTEGDAQHWTCKQTGKIIRFAMLDAYKRYGNEQLCGLTKLGLPKSNEIPIENIKPPANPTKYAHLAGKGIVVQAFERGDLINDPGHLVDNPPGGGGIYPIHMNDGLGAEIAAALQQNSNANQLQAIVLEANKIISIATQ